MSEVKNYEKVTEIAGKHLGKVGGDGYKDSSRTISGYSSHS